MRIFPFRVRFGTSTVLNDIGLEGTLFDEAVAEQPHAVHVVSVRLKYVLHADI